MYKENFTWTNLKTINHCINILTCDVKEQSSAEVSIRNVSEFIHPITTTKSVTWLFLLTFFRGLYFNFEWVSDYCLTPMQQFFLLYHVENKLIFYVNINCMILIYESGCGRYPLLFHKIPTMRVDLVLKRTSSSFHWKLTCSRHDIAELVSCNLC
jgi:hypothetical protein